MLVTIYLRTGQPAKALATLNSRMGSTDGTPGISLSREELSALGLRHRIVLASIQFAPAS